MTEQSDAPTHSTDDILSWFTERHDDLEDQLRDKGGNTLVLKALTRFTEPYHCEAIFDALVSNPSCPENRGVFCVSMTGGS